MGLAAYELFDNVDFDQWFKNQLLGELQVNHYRYSHCFELLCINKKILILGCLLYGCDFTEVKLHSIIFMYIYFVYFAFFFCLFIFF